MSRRPRGLESDGIVARGAYPEVPPRVEYSPTEYGDSLRACEIGEHGGRPVTEAMCQWGKKHMTAGAARKLGASQGAVGSEIPEFLRQNSLKRELEQRGYISCH